MSRFHAFNIVNLILIFFRNGEWNINNRVIFLCDFLYLRDFELIDLFLGMLNILLVHLISKLLKLNFPSIVVAQCESTFKQAFPEHEHV